MKKILSVLLTMTLTLGLILSAGTTAYGTPGGTTKRLCGNDRFETSVAISQEGWGSSDYVVICTGEGDDKFPDALAGAPIAKMYNAPLLLTNTDCINGIIEDEIKRLGAKNAIILGGNSVITADTETQLAGFGLNVERLWGENRCDTAVKIANRLHSKYNFKKAMLTTGYEFQYALMAAPFAAEIPILFSEKNSLSSYTKKALIDLGIEEVEIIGGSNVISDSILSEINNMGIYAYRIGGNSLEDVNMNIIKKYDPSPDKMALARNDLFPDALSGAAFALKNDAKIFLVGSNSVAPTLKSFILNLNTTENYIFGGPVAVSNSVVNELIPPTINVPPIQIIPDINIPDLDIQVPGLVSTAGNTPGNISNYGFAAIKGDWIYFTLNEGLFKVKKDGSSLDKLCDGLPLYLNVVGDFVYFSDSNDQGHMYKVKTDGTGKTKLTDDKVEDISVLGNWIYYKNKSDSMPYKVKIDGTGRTKIGVFGVRRMVISGGWIYFMTTGSTEYVDRMKMDGTGVEEIVKKDVRFFNVAGDYIYYANGDDQNKIYKAKISSSNVDTKISDNSAFMLNVVGDYIYYGKDVNQESRIYRMKIDGTGNTKFNDINSGYPNIVGEWIYYVQNVSNQSKFYRIKLDGTQNQSIQVQTP